MIKATCSNCGKKIKSKLAPSLMYKVGYRAVGSAFYCDECVGSWAERNGEDFEEEYGTKNSERMFTRWILDYCNRR